MKIKQTVERWYTRLMPASLVSRIYGLYMLTLTVFVTLGLATFYHYQFDQHIEDAQDIANLVVDVMSTSVSDSAVIGDYDTIKRTLQGAVQRSQFKSGMWIDVKGAASLTVNNDVPPLYSSPAWLKNIVAARLFDVNRNIRVGGVDYGVLRLSLSEEAIAGTFWQLTQLAVVIGLASLIGGFVLIGYPLRRWLQTLDRVKAFEDGLASGGVVDERLLTGEVPEELGQVFAVLTRTATSLRKELESRESTLTSLQNVVKELLPESAAVPANSEDGIKQTIALIVELVNEREAGRRELLAAKNAAEAASQAKSDFLATMSHEIRTPMNGILGTAQLLDNRDITEVQRKECIRILQSSGETLLALLNDILDLSKVEAGKLELQPEPTAPAQLAQETVALFTELAQQKGLSLGFSCSLPAHNHYLLDGGRIRQMMSNLINNAIKFTSAGRIEVELSESGGADMRSHIEFAVKDTGIGIKEDKHELLFQNFSQVDSSTTRQHGGSGLGLAIVRQLAHAMGGTVGFESRTGRGSRFWFRIPAPAAAAVSGETGPAATAPAKDGAATRGHVLVAEDTPTNRMVLSMMLSRLRISAHMAEDGAQAVESYIAGGRYDCVLMDMRMPNVDGVEAARRIRQWEAAHGAPRCPIIAITANAYDDDRRVCLEAGMDDFLSKPIIMAKLQETLDRWLVTAGAARSAPKRAATL